MKQETKLALGTIAFLIAVFCAIFWIMSNNVTSAVALAVSSRPVVIVDAGHGGEDGGAVGISGTRESEINLEVALRLEQVLALCGIPVKMIRTEDRALYTQGQTISEKKVSDLRHRVEIVQTTLNPVLVSIHQNHFSDSRYDGAQVFYAKTEGSRNWAEKTQEILRLTLDPGNHRQCKEASSVYLMEQISCPGILVECGFLSNREEEQKLQRNEYQTKLACAIGLAVAEFLEEGEKREI